MKEEVQKIISQSKWIVMKDQDDIKMLQVQKGASKINIYWSKMTVIVLKKGARATVL